MNSGNNVIVTLVCICLRYIKTISRNDGDGRGAHIDAKINDISYSDEIMAYHRACFEYAMGFRDHCTIISQITKIAIF